MVLYKSPSFELSVPLSFLSSKPTNSPSVFPSTLPSSSPYFDLSSLPSVFPYSYLSNHLKFHRWYYLKAYLSNHLKFHQWYHIKVHLSNYLSLHRFHLPSQQIPLQFFHRHFHHSIRPKFLHLSPQISHL